MKWYYVVHDHTVMIIYTLGHGVWSSPVMSGSRPPPCRNFTFTSIDKHRALLFGGFLPEGRCRVNHLYLFDFSIMVCCMDDLLQKLELQTAHTLHYAMPSYVILIHKMAEQARLGNKIWPKPQQNEASQPIIQVRNANIYMTVCKVFDMLESHRTG